MGSFGQSAFGGAGEWDSASQGRIDHAWLRKALSVSVNGQVSPNEVWHTRSGTKWLGPTYKRQDATIRGFKSDTANRYAIALTTDASTGWAHFFQGDAVLVNASNTVSSSTSASGILSIVTATGTGWSVDDQVIFESLPAAGYPYFNRWLTVTAISGTSITLKDDMGVAFTFDTPTNSVATATIKRVQRFTTGILGVLANTQIVNLGTPVLGGPIKALLLNAAYAPVLVSITDLTGSFPVLTVAAAAFVDGPYLAPQPGGGTVSGGSVYSGAGVTYTPSDGTTFSSVDVGRHIRLYHEPAAWASGTAYTTGQQVTYQGVWWRWIGDATTYAGVTGVVPGTLYTTAAGTQAALWGIVGDAGRWAWAIITAQATTSCTITFQTSLNSANGATITACRLGEFYTGVYPGTGFMHLGRLYLGGCHEACFAASMAGSNKLLTFSPTDIYGQVYDDYGFFEQISGASQDQIVWFKPDIRGLLIGTYAEEFLLSAGGDSEVITPFNKTVRRVSTYGSYARNAVDAGFTTIFMQHARGQVFEYLTEVGSAPSGRSLNDFNYNLVQRASGFIDLGYTENRIPVIWGAASDGQLFGCTYRRTSHSIATEPDIQAWSRHRIADGGVLVKTLCSLVPINNIDYLYLTTAAVSSSYGIANSVERLMPFWLAEEANTL